MPNVSVPPTALRASDLCNTHPMDSSRLFMALLNLVHDSDHQGPLGPARSIIAAPILRRLLSALHFRDTGTLKHSRRVGLISVGIAARLGWEDDDLRIIEIASLMHDIGKIGIPDHILRKPGKLSPDESDYIAVYHRVALALLQACQVHADVTGIIAQSHGVDEENRSSRHALSLGARILAVADAYDSLTTEQCFRAPFDRKDALQILEEQSGKQFDRNVVTALCRWLDSADAARLADERAAEISIHVDAPVDMETRMNANQLCHVFHHLYLLESLYDAFYVVDSNRQVMIWSSGASRLTGRSAPDAMRKKWTRQLVCPNHVLADPVEAVFRTGEPVCHGMLVKTADGSSAKVDVQTIPIQDEGGDVCGIVELICNGKESKRHRGQFRTLQIAATRDPLTGVFNRGELERKLQEIYDAWNDGTGAPFSVMFMDLDHFKSINDNLSHAIGDRVLIDCARILQDELYSGEIVARYGGEEFVILCPETDVETARVRAERLRRIIMATKFADIDELKVTASFGIADIGPGDQVKTVVSRADQALYDAKRNGRNCTCISMREPETKSDRKRDQSKGTPSVTAKLTTYIFEDMLQMKLAGFVENQRAKILKIEPKLLELKIGSSGILSSWTRASLERMPVKLRIDFAESVSDAGSHGRPLLELSILVEPVARTVNDEQFRNRANILLEELRSYLIAN